MATLKLYRIAVEVTAAHLTTGNIKAPAPKYRTVRAQSPANAARAGERLAAALFPRTIELEGHPNWAVEVRADVLGEVTP
jgi:hypothetical protein